MPASGCKSGMSGEPYKPIKVSGKRSKESIHESAKAYAEAYNDEQ
jgi:hypothetical protein